MSAGFSRRQALTILGAAPLALAQPVRLGAQSGPPPPPAIGLVSRHVQWTSLEDATASLRHSGTGTMTSTDGDHSRSTSAISPPMDGAREDTPLNLIAWTALRGAPPYLNTDRRAVNDGSCR